VVGAIVFGYFQRRQPELFSVSMLSCLNAQFSGGSIDFPDVIHGLNLAPGVAPGKARGIIYSIDSFLVFASLNSILLNLFFYRVCLISLDFSSFLPMSQRKNTVSPQSLLQRRVISSATTEKDTIGHSGKIEKMTTPYAF
jgi:hypothetical protein